jgi:predicted ArsR family transcriptional regulator
VSGEAAESPGQPRRRDRTTVGLPVLTSHACPYPQLAEQDRGVCSAERLMLEDLVGAPVKLSECRLDGDDCCRFTVHAVEGVASGGVSASNPC